MNKVYCYCYQQCTIIVHFLSSEKACSCTFGIPTNKAFKMCLKGTKQSHTLFWLISLILMSSNRGVENVFKSCPRIISPSDRECEPLVRPVQGGTPTHSYTTTHARTHTHTHTHTQLIRDKEVHFDFHTAPYLWPNRSEGLASWLT